MGDSDESRPETHPQHEVTVNDFAVGMYEVTFEQYDRFCEDTGQKKPNDESWGRGKQPVINVSWEDAKAFSKWLSEKNGLQFDLPSEAQWEYLSRAGTTTRYWTGANLPENGANCSGCGSRWDGKMTSPVGSFPANPWGIHDTAGNVAEWTLDDVHPNYEMAPKDGTAWFDGSAKDKVYRGGAWDYPTTDLSSAMRDWSSRTSRHKNIGFRLVINNPPLADKRK